MGTLKNGRYEVLNLILACGIAAISTFGSSSARADSDYEVSVNTSSLLGTGATLTFDFIAGGGSQPNSVSILGYVTDGTSGPTSSAGSVSGALPGSVTLSNASFFNELQQGLTLGNSISFEVDATSNTPTSGSLPDTFSLFLLDPTASYSLTNTADPTGANSLVTLQIDGTSGGNIANYSGSAPSIPISIKTPTIRAPEIDGSSAISALTLLLGALAVICGRGLNPQARSDRPPGMA